MTKGTRAQVRLTLEILLNDNWHDDADIAQVTKQAVASARQKLGELLRDGSVTVLGKPVVTCVKFDSEGL